MVARVQHLSFLLSVGLFFSACDRGGSGAENASGSMQQDTQSLETKGPGYLPSRGHKRPGKSSDRSSEINSEWEKKLNLPIPIGMTSPVGVPVPEGFQFMNRFRHMYRYSGRVNFNKTLDFYRRVLDTMHIEEKEEGYWEFSRAGIKTGIQNDPVIVRVRSNAPRGVVISMGYQDPSRAAGQKKESVVPEKRPRKKGFGELKELYDFENRKNQPVSQKSLRSPQNY